MKVEGLPDIARVAPGRLSLAIDIDERHIHIERLTRPPELAVNDEPRAQRASGTDRVRRGPRCIPGFLE